MRVAPDLSQQEHFTFIRITKLDAAKRQLRTAIELWFQEGDPVAIHTLVYAAHEIIHRLFRNAGHKGLLFDLAPAETLPIDIEATTDELQRLQTEFPKYLKKDANFFKHAERETGPDEAIVFSPDVNESFIVVCLLGLERLQKTSDDAGRAFKFWYRVNRPAEFESAGAPPLSVQTLARWNVEKPEFFRRYLAETRDSTVS